MQSLSAWASDAIGLSPTTQVRLLTTVGVILSLLLVRWMVLKGVHRRVTDLHTRYRWHKGANYTAGVISILVVVRIWLVDFAGAATYLGLLSAGLAIALKDPLANLAAWLFILWRRPLEVGDRVQIGGNAGDVVDIRLFQFTLLEIGNWVEADQTTGRLIHVPNALVFTLPLANYTRGFHAIWTELPVQVTFESDWAKARTILQEIAERRGSRTEEEAGLASTATATRYALPKGAFSPTVYVSVRDSGVMLTLRTPCAPRERRRVTDAIWQDVLRAFAECPDVDFAYPTTRFYSNDTEGKPGKVATAAPAPSSS